MMKLKFVNVNVWVGGRLLDPLIKFLSNQKPDILTIQEAYNEHGKNYPKNLRTIDLFKEILGFEFVHYSPLFILISNGHKSMLGNGTFSKFPMTKKSEILIYDGELGEFEEGNEDTNPLVPRKLQHSQIQIENKKLNIFNVQGVWNTHGRDTKDRLQMSEIIADAVKDKENVVLAGDFNVNEDTQSIANIEEYLVNIFKGERKTSFNLKYKKDPGFLTSVVDMIFVSPNIKVLEHESPNVDVSDHLPQVAILEI